MMTGIVTSGVISTILTAEIVKRVESAVQLAEEAKDALLVSEKTKQKAESEMG